MATYPLQREDGLTVREQVEAVILFVGAGGGDSGLLLFYDLRQGAARGRAHEHRIITPTVTSGIDPTRVSGATIMRSTNMTKSAAAGAELPS